MRTVWLLLVGITFGFSGGPAWSQPLPDSLHMNWQPVDSLNATLPAGVQVFAGGNEELPLRAWYVRIDEPDRELTTRVVVSDEPDRRETVSTFARDSSACVAVNGGYFYMQKVPSEAVGLLVHGGEIISPATDTVEREGRSYEAARAAIGFTPQDRIEIGWVTNRQDTTYRWKAPPSHRPGRPGGPLHYWYARPWRVRDALSAGPMLLEDGWPRVTGDEEVFFGTAIPEVHPRTAAGITAEGELIVMVVDGRQPASRGVHLESLARLMQSAGAVDALNLDGGGSTALVVQGKLVNRPEGDRRQREVLSALVTYCGATVSKAK